MEDQIKNILEEFNKKHRMFKSELEEDILTDVYRIKMYDLLTKNRISVGLHIQDLEFSRLGLEDEINYTLEDMLSKLKGGK